MKHTILYVGAVVVLSRLLSLYKCFLIFFRQKGVYLQIILYFCALEISPIIMLSGTRQQERVKLPMWLNITLIALFTAIAVTLILRFTVYKDNLLVNYISSLLLGVTCLVLFYTRRFKHTKKTGTMYTVVTVLLTVMGVVYTGMGLLGILTMFGII